MRKIIILTIFIVFFFNVNYAQKSIDLMTKSVEYFNAGDVENAVKYSENAVKEAEKEEGKESYIYVFMCNKRNFIYVNTGKIKKLEQSSNENYELLSILVKEDKELYQDLYIEALSILCDYYQQVGNSVALDTLLVQLIKYYPEEDYDKAVSYNNLAAHYRKQGYAYKAEPLYFKAVSLYEKVEGKDQNYAIMLST